MISIETRIMMAEAHAKGCLGFALRTQDAHKGEFNEATDKAWQDYDDALALLTELYKELNASKS